MEKHAALEFGCEPGLQLPLLQKLETMGEIKEVLFSLFEEIQDRIVDRRSAKQTDLTRKINELIEKRYADPDLDVNRIAFELSLSPTYMSRIYRQHSLSGIVDVINDTRMNKAREMLERTDWSVAEIAEKIGYSNNSYFHRVFKKKFGVTPKDYRDVRARQTASAGLQGV
jgi:YesN/AraC family two-component response regulator